MADLELKYFRVKVKLTCPMLGTVPKNRDVYTKFIHTKAVEAAEKMRKAMEKKGLDPDTTPAMANGGPATEATLAEIAKDVENVDEGDREEAGWTTFLSDTEGRFLSGHMIKGHLSAAAQVMKTFGTGPTQVKQLNDKVKKYLFIHQKRIRINEVPTPDSTDELIDDLLITIGPDGPMCERPLRELCAPVY